MTITWTEHGVPHVFAGDLAGVGYGQGWAFAQLNACLLADQILKVRGERARHLGAGKDDEHVRSDLAYRFLDHTGRGRAAWDVQPPAVRDLVAGYAEGFNDSIQAHRDELPCGDATWLQPIDGPTLFAYYSDVSTVAGERQLHDYLVDAQPPALFVQPPSRPKRAFSDRFKSLPGSNGWAIGKERTTAGTAITIANPHFPWEGEFRLFESHLTVPGSLDVYGASLMGVPGVTIGFNHNVSWTHTFSRGNRFVLYVLELDPSDPTRYLRDGRSVAMRSETIEVRVLLADGSESTRTQTMWSTEMGPVVAIPEFGGWSAETVFALRDANANNTAMIEQFVGMATADSLNAFRSTFETVQGIPWVHTMAASRDGRVWYADGSSTPNLSDDALNELRETTDPTARLLRLFGVAALPGTESRFDWVDDEESRGDGVIAFKNAPQLERQDFVFNSNDSHWLSNPGRVLEGFSPMFGNENAPLRPRTQMNALSLRRKDGAGGADGLFTLAEAQAAMLANDGLTERRLRPQLLAACETAPDEVAAGTEYSTTDLCEILRRWDGRADLGSSGALLWREFLGGFTIDDIKTGSRLYDEAFDPARPLETPRNLTSDTSDVFSELRSAAQRLSEAGLAADATIARGQSVQLGRVRHRMHGGSRNEGVLNLMIRDDLNSVIDAEAESPPAQINATTHLGNDGYVFNYGSGFLLAVELTEQGPRAEVVVGYGQSSDADSPFFADQVELLAEKRWRTVFFDRDAVDSNAVRVESLDGPGGS